MLTHNPNQPALTMAINGLAHDHGLPALINTFQEIEFLDNPDIVVKLNQLTADENLCVCVPDMGRFMPTDFALSQLASQIGCKMDKYYLNASPTERMEELNRRFARAGNEVEVKLRSTLIGAGTNGSDGTLKAIVSPGFTAIPDSQVAELIYKALQEVEPNIGLVSAHITSRTVSYSIRIGKAFCPGESSVGDLNGCLQIFNSSVGFRSISISARILRLLCGNGLAAPIANSTLVRLKHSAGLSIERIAAELGDKLISLPGQLRQAGQILQTSRTVVIDNIEETISRTLQQSHLPRKLVQPLMLAYNREPHASAFGLVQAMTDAHTLHEIGMKPEERHQLETAAGQFLQNLIGQQ